MQKAAIPKGTRDFGPVVMAQRNHITSVIKEVYESFGFVPIETPSMENLSTLTGKYGEEGDKLPRHGKARFHHRLDALL